MKDNQRFFASLMLWLLCSGGILPLLKLFLPYYCYYQHEKEFQINISVFTMPFLSTIPVIIDCTVLLSSPLLKCSARKPHVSNSFFLVSRHHIAGYSSSYSCWLLDTILGYCYPCQMFLLIFSERDFLKVVLSL